MTRFVTKILLSGVILCMASKPGVARGPWKLESPNGHLAITVFLTKPAQGSDAAADRVRLYYSVTCNQQEVVRESPRSKPTGGKPSLEASGV